MMRAFGETTYRFFTPPPMCGSRTYILDPLRAQHVKSCWGVWGSGKTTTVNGHVPPSAPLCYKVVGHAGPVRGLNA